MRNDCFIFTRIKVFCSIDQTVYKNKSYFITSFNNGKSVFFLFFYFIRYENENDKTFLENFETIAQKYEQRKQKIKIDVRESFFTLYFCLQIFILKEELENEKIPPEYRITFGEKPEGITSKEYELLYIETLYTIKHKIGTTTSRHSEGENDLYSYAQEAFGLSSEDHQRLLNKASEEKVSIEIKITSFNIVFISHQY